MQTVKRSLATATMFCFGVSFWGTAQNQQMTVSQIIRLAEEKALLQPNLAMILETTRLKTENMKKSYWPKMDLNGLATWQNEVPGLDIQLPNFTPPEAPRQQIKLSLDLQQTIYDGGVTRSNRNLTSAEGAEDAQKVVVQMYALRSRVSDLFFTIVRMDKQLEQYRNRLEDLSAREKDLEAGTLAGTVLLTERSLIQVEQLRLRQSMVGLEEGRAAAYAMLGELTQGAVTPTMGLQLVDWLPNPTLQGGRPELKLFELQRKRTHAAEKIHQRYPKIFAFGQVGYGNPTYNMLNDDFGEFYMVGLKLNWNIWDWKQTGRNKQVLSIQRDILHRQELQFNQEVALAVQQTDGQIARWSKMMQMDAEIMALYDKILEVSRARWKNGTITATDYLADLTRSADARLAYELHRIEKAQSEINRLIIKGEPF